ncbi:hypothetical protein PF003_g2663 [Phytophthora fragariae]|nr:hypothetical protein PF003_g2663 [Phytophthora fragariae]
MAKAKIQQRIGRAAQRDANRASLGLSEVTEAGTIK